MCGKGKCACASRISADIQILCHHIYEYKKGIRNLVLHTMNNTDLSIAEEHLKKNNIEYCLQLVSDKKMNIFFGKSECVNIVKTFAHKSLSQITHEEDFMLGVMLGYDRMQQCERFLKRKTIDKNVQSVNTFSLLHSA